MPKKSKFYSKTPVVPAKQIAGTNPYGPIMVGAATSPTVPRREAVIHGLGTPTRPFGHPSVKGVHGYGHVAKEKQGHLRLSGNSGAHQVGVKKPKV